MPKTGFDRPKSFDSSRFSPTNFTAFFDEFRPREGGPGRPREAQRGVKFFTGRLIKV